MDNVRVLLCAILAVTFFSLVTPVIPLFAKGNGTQVGGGKIGGGGIVNGYRVDEGKRISGVSATVPLQLDSELRAGILP